MMSLVLDHFACCPDCGTNADIVGSISATEVFAGRILDTPLEGGGLYRCTACQLGFRWPRLPKNKLDMLYEHGGDQTWASSAHARCDWSIGRHWISQNLTRDKSILDVGCFDGGFLEGFGDAYKLFGIEIHPQARLRAVAKGVSMAGTDFSKITGQFDCITAFDVIEHVENPAFFLSQCLEAVRSGGYILISTGNMDSVTFRLMGSRYWYCSIAEHISFVSPKWFFGKVSDMGCQVKQLKTFAHDNAPILRRLKELTANILFWMHPSLLGALRRIGFGQKDVLQHPVLAAHPPGWGTAHDHFMVLLKKL